LALCSAAGFVLRNSTAVIKDTVPNNCIGIAGDLLMDIPGIPGDVLKNGLNFTTLSKDD